MNNINVTNTTKYIDNVSGFVNKTYDNLSYFDLYGTSVIIFIVITLFIFVIFAYCKVMQTKQQVADDWTNQRCKPQNMLFAGLITHPENTTAFQYTSDNFQYCIQNILTNIAGYALEPFHYMIQSLTNVFKEIADSIQQIRELNNKIRNNFKEFAQDVLNRILNVMIPIQKMFIALMDTFQKIQGTMTATLYTMLGSYYTLQSLMGAIIDLIIKILFALVIVIMGLWALPMTWPVAISTTAVFAAIAVPLSIIIYFMSEVLHIKSASIPKLRCFDEDTLITLENGTKINIKDIQVGDKLLNKSYVTAKIKVTAINIQMFRLNNIIVSESHLVKFKDKWIRVKNHPKANPIMYNKDYLYCLNTSNKVIELNNIIFSDWDEIFVNELSILNSFVNLEDIHKHIDDGFEETTEIKLYRGPIQIKNIKIGDVLENGSIVYGLVEIDARKLRKYLNNTSLNKIYHLLTTDGKFMYLNKSNLIYAYAKDYNNLIDKFII